ncbi:ATP synthase subunit beta protein [Rutstroemia sp. NJR-2017a BBW]|nr:ATP synthase subunit beta protein [Rutstroemia sp. NJR-2017a BBW]
MKILAGLSQPQPPPQHQQPHPQAALHQPHVASSHGPVSQQQQWPAPVPSVPTPAPPNNTKVVDPATIIEWSAGLRCVMRTVAKHDQVLQEIRKMMKVQHEHEEQWWKGRQALIEKQQVRKEGQRKLEEVLKAVGGSTSTGASNTSPEELARELETFDMKVYKAQTQMVREMNGKLRSLGVPFFGTKSELVRTSGKTEPGQNVANGPGVEKTVIDESDLVELQKKMLTILEDLCND